MNFFKKRPIELHCYTCRADVYNYAPIQETPKISRDWFKRSPTSSDHVSAKQCPSLRDTLKLGITLPLWSDLRLQISSLSDKEGWWKYQYSDKQSSMNSHFFDQMGQPEIDKSYFCLKLESPWLFTCEEDIDFLYSGDQIELLNYGFIQIMKGKINFKHQHATNINTIVAKKESEQEFVLPFLFPLLNLIPLTERNVTVVNHLISDEHWVNLRASSVPSSFSHFYYKHKKLRQSKKPFVFTTED
jgi:hypothetical protein